jgi:hypothetical protein
MIREGYTGCNTCHADPSGAGILTQYGRGMEEVVLRTPYKKDADPGKVGNFMFGAFDLPAQLLLQTDIRNMLLTYFPQTFPKSNAQISDYVMQADQAAQLKIGRFRLNGSIGYTPPSDGYQGPNNSTIAIYGGGQSAAITNQPAGWGAILARQYWIGVDIGKDEEFLLRIGRMNVPFGIRTVEHPFLVRSVTRTDINDSQEEGVSLAYSGEKVRGEVMAIAGNYAIHGDPNWDAPHERGGAGFVEWLPSTHAAIGASALITYADLARYDLDSSLNAAPIWRHAYGLTARVSPVKPLVILAEVDALLNSQPFVLNAAGVSTANNHFGLVGLLQADLQVVQGVHILAAGELFDGHIHESGSECGFQPSPGSCGVWDTTTAAAWIGAWWFFAPHLDVRADLVYVDAPAIGATTTLPGTSFTVQFHGYL